MEVADVINRVRELGRNEGCYRVEEQEDGIRILLWTEGHQYSIAVKPGTPHPVDGTAKSYLGCIASTRKPRPGESWTRGNDLADGPLTEETWQAIVADIVGYELLPVELTPEPVSVGVEAN